MGIDIDIKTNRSKRNLLTLNGWFAFEYEDRKKILDLITKVLKEYR
tara:strand:+ start:479 stop:616 length:138 start_codon:yes stop_codon:yes gene_type:complete